MRPAPIDVKVPWEGKHAMAAGWAIHERIQQSAVYAEFMGPGDLVFDVGANRGVKTLVFRRLGARVVAIEPLAHFGALVVPELRWKWGKDPDVTIVPVAVAPTPTVRFYIHKNLPWLSSLQVDWMTRSAHRVFYALGVNAIPREVPARTLDSLVDEFGDPMFVKIDVEGSEDLVMSTLTRPLRALSLEYHEDWIPRGALRRLDSLGDYEYNYILGNAHEWRLDAWTSSGALVADMRRRLTKEGPGSWGDLFARRRDG